MCEQCPESMGGHFVINRGVSVLVRLIDNVQIVLCENYLQTEDQMAQTMVHETIHAFDHCRVHLDWNNCRHHACTEVDTRCFRLTL